MVSGFVASRNICADGRVELDEIPVSRQIWTAAEIERTQLPPLHSVLFGAFRIVDIQHISSADSSNSPKIKSSYIDIAFGADKGFIAGVHRFTVSELEGSAILGDRRQIAIAFEHTSCDPKNIEPLSLRMLRTFHLWYAMLLFREGVANVLKAG